MALQHIARFWENQRAAGQTPAPVWLFLAASGGRQPVGYPLGWSALLTTAAASQRAAELAAQGDPVTLARITPEV